MKTLILLLLTVSLVACQKNDNTTMRKGVVEITYKAVNNDKGVCSPEYKAKTSLDEHGLPDNEIYIIRGETRYYNRQNIKFQTIPLQVKIDKLNQAGINENLACKNLRLEVEIEKCQYEFDSKNTGCPQIIIKGQEGFAGIDLITLQ